MQQPKYKREIRTAIINNVNKNKNSASLHNVLTVSDIMYRANNDVLHETLTEKEWDIWSIINSILRYDEKSVHSIRVFITAFTGVKCRKGR